MHGSSPTKLAFVTPDFSRHRAKHREIWDRERQTPRETNRPVAEAAISAAYAAAGLTPPRLFLWAPSPAQLARDWMSFPEQSRAGINLRGSFIDASRERLSRACLKWISADVHTSLSNPPHKIADTLSEQINRANHRAIGTVDVPLSKRFGRFARSLFDLKRPFRAWPSFTRAGASRHELGWLEPLAFLSSENATVNNALIDNLWRAALETSWIVPHENICWLADLPVTVKHDDRGRLHAAGGPALKYSDGSSTYAWKGVVVPGQYIENPAKITLDAINKEPDIFVRRCLIEILTPERFLRMGGANRIAKDDTGVLWHKMWWNGDAWAAVEVINGTAEPDGTFKHYYLQVPADLRTARAAVA